MWPEEVIKLLDMADDMVRRRLAKKLLAGNADKILLIVRQDINRARTAIIESEENRKIARKDERSVS